MDGWRVRGMEGKNVGDSNGQFDGFIIESCLHSHAPYLVLLSPLASSQPRLAISMKNQPSFITWPSMAVVRTPMCHWRHRTLSI